MDEENCGTASGSTNKGNTTPECWADAGLTKIRTLPIPEAPQNPKISVEEVLEAATEQNAHSEEPQSEDFEKIPSTQTEQQPKPKLRKHRKQLFTRTVKWWRKLKGKFSEPKDDYLPPPQPIKQRKNPLWSETYGKEIASSLDKRELKRQETINELLQVQINLIEDLLIVQKIYRDPLLLLGFLSEGEARRIFGGIEFLLPIHIQLRDGLFQTIVPDGRFDNIGQVVKNCIPKLEVYVAYCSKLFKVEKLLSKKRSTSRSFADFLNRCETSSFSRRLDLWSFLDSPRSHVMNIPLLIKQILKSTLETNADHGMLGKSLIELYDVLARVDKAIGDATC
ncbi:neuroepithelial cell-transforming gene 1 protein-like [Daphnia carinata]|uniref:neuroepithelial cell-transforming gene 1 protein-like n=1 Tax=Daphnia carinata TaxID=120202 RepID=UPI00257F81C9|nr:neuroepithelial cell-transforming gene 1 protein-like [Daphnia carinata]